MANIQNKTIMNWSSGKDCAAALYKLQKEGKYQVELLFTTVNSANKRINMHGLHEELLITQAAAFSIPIDILYLPEKLEMKAYNKLIYNKLIGYKREGFQFSAYGDIALEDLKKYREKQLKKVDLQPLFPLWKNDTKKQLQEFIQLGFKAIVISAAAKYFDSTILGTEIDQHFLKNLPSEVDPCGENGEFHTFCYDGPNFKHPVSYKKGEICTKKYPDPLSEGEVGVHFLDLLPFKYEFKG